MTSVVTHADLDAWLANTLGGAGNGNGNRNGLGMGVSSWPWQNRAIWRFPRPDLSAIPSADAISAFYVNLRCSSDNFGIGSAVKFWLERGLTAFTEYQVKAGQGGVPAGANINAYVSSAGPTSGEWPGSTRDSTNRGSFEGTPSDGQWIKVAMLDMGRWWYDNPSIGNLILVGVAKDETTTNQRCNFFTRESGSTPYAEFVFGSNRPPDKPSDVAVVNGEDGTSFTMTGRYTDPDGDTSTMVEFKFTPD